MKRWLHRALAIVLVAAVVLMYAHGIYREFVVEDGIEYYARLFRTHRLAPFALVLGIAAIVWAYCRLPMPRRRRVNLWLWGAANVVFTGLALYVFSAAMLMRAVEAQLHETGLRFVRPDGVKGWLLGTVPGTFAVGMLVTAGAGVSWLLLVARLRRGRPGQTAEQPQMNADERR